MSKVAKSIEELSFEQALERLDAIVTAMESDDLPLEKMLTQFEEGTQMAKLCQARLADAEVRIKKLEETLEKGMQLADFDLGKDDERV